MTVYDEEEKYEKGLNRRGFLKFLGIGTGVAVIAPKALFAKKEKTFTEEALEEFGTGEEVEFTGTYDNDLSKLKIGGEGYPLISISGPTVTRDVIDVTRLDSSGAYGEFISGLRTEVTLILHGLHLIEMKEYEFEVNLPDKTKLEFNGFVCSVENSCIHMNPSTTISVQVSGQPKIS